MVKFFPPHLTAACDSEADSGKSSNDVFIGPKTLARSIMASSSTSSIRLGSSSPWPDTLTRFETGHMRRRLFGAGRNSSSKLRGEVFEESANSRLEILGSGATFVHLVLCNIAVAVTNPRRSNGVHGSRAIARWLLIQLSWGPRITFNAASICLGRASPTQ